MTAIVRIADVSCEEGMSNVEKKIKEENEVEKG